MMKISEFKKLEEKINGQNFSQSYKNINIVLNILSYFGNLASIFLAYFFMAGVISGPLSDSPVAVFLASVIILAGVELLKRDIFDKFSVSYLRTKTLGKATLPLFLFSFLIISASFYSSLTGAKEFSSKEKQIEQVKEDDIKIYSDSLTKVYDAKIKPIEKDIESYTLKIEEKDKEQAIINQALQDKGSLNRSQRERNRQLAEEKTYLDGKISESETKISKLKSELKSEVSEYEEERSKDTDSEKKDNSKNSLIFVILSTIIEFVILGGVFFNEYYKFRSYREFRDKIDRDPNYQKWMLYDEILKIIYSEEAKVGEKLASNKAMIEMCKINGVVVLPKDMVNFLKIINSLGIIKSSGSSRYINKQRELSFEVLKKHFNIE
jgi:hypothetical protein